MSAPLRAAQALACLLCIAGAVAADPDLRTLGVDGDAYVRAGSYRGQNFGGEPLLYVKLDNNPSYVRETWATWAIGPRHYDAYASSTYFANWRAAALVLTPAIVAEDAATTTFVVEIVASPIEQGALTWDSRPLPASPVLSYALDGAALQVGVPVEIRIDAAWQAALAMEWEAAHLTVRIRSLQAGAKRYVAFASDEHPDLPGPRLALRGTIDPAVIDGYEVPAAARIDVGPAPAPGAAAMPYDRFGDDYLVMASSGAGLRGMADAFTAVVRTGLHGAAARWRDVVHQSRVAFVEGAPDAEAGITLREGLSPTDRHVSLLLSAGEGLLVRSRAVVGGLTHTVAVPGVHAPRLLRLTRSGDGITAEHSADGAVWTAVATVTVPDAQPMRVGWLTSGGSGRSETVIDAFHLLGAPEPAHSDPAPGILAPDDDTFVRGGSYALRQFGLDPQLWAKRDGNLSYTRETWLGWDLQRRLWAGNDAFTGWEGAQLSLTVDAMGSDAATTTWVAELVDAVDWREDSLTWANRPATTVPVAAATIPGAALTPGGTVTIDVSDAFLHARDAFPHRRLTLRIRALDAGAQRWVAFASDEHPGLPGPRLTGVVAPLGAG